CRVSTRPATRSAVRGGKSSVITIMYTFVSYSVKPENHSFFGDLGQESENERRKLRGLPPTDRASLRITRKRDWSRGDRTNRATRSMAAIDLSRLPTTPAPQRCNASLTVMLAVRGHFFAINSVAINTNVPHRAKRFVRHQDALAVEILDLDAALLAD